MPWTQSHHFPIHWEARGPVDAPPLLLVMGLAFSSRAWEGLPDALAQHFRVITFDNRWTGRSRPSAEHGAQTSKLKRFGSYFFSIGDLADDAEAVLREALAAHERSAFVFGVSMGGMIAEELALRHPRRVRALALGCTFAGFLWSTKPSLDVMVDLFVSTTMPAGDRHARMARHLVSDTFLGAERERFERWIRAAEFGGPRLALSQLSAVQRHDTTKRLRELAVPTLVITGDADRLVPAENSRALAELIPGAKLELLAGAGHVFPLEREADTVRALAAHFGAHVER